MSRHWMFARCSIAFCAAVLAAQEPPRTPPAAAQPPAAGAPSTAAQKIMGDVAPKLAELTDNVLFGDVWQRPGLSQRDRSLITVAALIAMNRPEQLRSHMARARANGVTREEIAEIITHLAFYTGWPNAISAVGVAREVFRDPPAQARPDPAPDRREP
ncbi:MAG: carboxymuconolactone decarboxylase family protein [Bryobacteraceae bacterium]|nr:carboxymuconolactone decarboxylase family protein [Bryobacteraceae bacterium]